MFTQSILNKQMERINYVSDLTLEIRKIIYTINIIEKMNGEFII